MSGFEITPVPTEDEAAAIAAAMETVLREPQSTVPVLSKWKMSGRDYNGSDQEDTRR